VSQELVKKKKSTYLKKHAGRKAYFKIFFPFQFFTVFLRSCSKKTVMRLYKDDGVDVVGLKEGDHRFEWDFGDGFFDSFENSSLKKGEIHAVLDLHKTEHVFRSVLQVKGFVETICDNCLESIRIPVGKRLEMVVKLTETPQEDDPDREVYYVSVSEGKFFVGQHVYDAVYLSLPIRKTCGLTAAASCNVEMLKKLSTANDNNSQGGDDKDPRWDKLKDLLK
jgi:uncharacterized protein